MPVLGLFLAILLAIAAEIAMPAAPEPPPEHAR